MRRSIFDLRCNVSCTIDSVRSALYRTERPTLVKHALVEHVRFVGKQDQCIDLTRLFRVHKVRPHVYAACFGVKIRHCAPFPRCNNLILITPRLLLSVLASPRIVLQTRQTDDDIKRLVVFIDALIKEQERGAQVIEIK